MSSSFVVIDVVAVSDGRDICSTQPSRADDVFVRSVKVRRKTSSIIVFHSVIFLMFMKMLTLSQWEKFFPVPIICMKKLIWSVKGPEAHSSHNVFGHGVAGYQAHRLIYSADSNQGDKFSVGHPANWVRWQFVLRLPVSCYFPVSQLVSSVRKQKQTIAQLTARS